MTRTERFGLGSRIDHSLLELLEFLRKAMYAPITRKVALLEGASEIIDSLRFFTQLAWEAHLIAHNQFSVFGSDIEELGKIIGGWKKGLISKTSASRAEERRE
ncbi:MAG: four helix bundle protein [bacterium]|nr:four helix bundle protein [bacterium]